jgi:glucuronoarabinoxylan endo-1,4-beta-xylanase
MRTALFPFGLGLAACTLPVEGEPLEKELAAQDGTTANVCWQEPRQTISGFGASSAWTAPDLPDELADELFSVDRIGLSLLRLRITPNGTTSETATALKAQERGAAVWAAPWSPPGAWKTSGTDNNGGSLLPEQYPAWAARLAAFVGTLEAAGVELMALSAQNEPDYVAEWETCVWQPHELATFVGEHLVPALAAEGVSPRLLAPESSGWDDVARYGETLMTHANAGPAIGIVATHSYGMATPWAYDLPASRGKELWMTEWSDPTRGPVDSGMDSGLVVARAIHDNLTIAEVNAWHYWWLVDRDDTPPSRGALLSEGVITRRAYVTGQFSRFVRPGSRRIRGSGGIQGDVRVSAFLRETGSDLVVVAINESTTPVTQTFDFSGAEVSDLVPYVTNADVTLEEQPAVAGAPLVSYELSPRSVTTFVAPVTITADAPVNPECEVVAPRRVQPEEESTASGCSCRQAGEKRGAPWGTVLLALSLVVRRWRPVSANRS